MAKKTPWWHKPKPNDDEEKDCREDNNPEIKRPIKTDKSRNYGRDMEDWESERARFFRSPFDSEFDRMFGESPFGFRNNLFSDMEHEFEAMHSRMDKIFQQTMEGRLQKPGNGGPFVYGFSMRTGPDGIPHIQEFGNVNPEMMRKPHQNEGLPFRGKSEFSGAPALGELPVKANETEILQREPLTDVMENDKNVCITMELPGIEKKDIELNVEDEELVVQVDSPVRKYFKRQQLPTEVDPKTITASFNNGVLDINLKRQKPKPKKGKKIKIE